MRNYSKVLRGLLVVLVASFGLTNAYADPDQTPVDRFPNGIYLGVGLGHATVDYVEGEAVSNVLDEVFGLAPMAFVGYQFNQYISLEGSYSHLFDSSNDGNQTFGPDHKKFTAFDLTLKLTKQFDFGLNLFAQAGGAYVRQDVFNQEFANDTTPLVNITESKLVPVAGVGIGYRYRGFETTLRWKRTFSSGDIVKSDYFPVTIAWHFS